MFGQLSMVQGFAPFPHGADNGHSDTAHKDSQEVRQATGRGNLVAFHMRQRDTGQRQEEHGYA